MGWLNAASQSVKHPHLFSDGGGENEATFFSAKRWDRINRTDLIESATPFHDAQVMGSYQESNPLRLTILAAMSDDYITAPQHFLTNPVYLNMI